MERHVLVPIDGSEPSWNALDHVIDTFGGARITVLHVVDPAEAVYADAEGGVYDPSAYDRIIDAGEDLLEEAVDHLEGSAIGDESEVSGEIETGRPARAIVEFARENDVDHIVIGSHGRSGVSRVLLGSVAESVTRRADLPVTIVP